MGIRKKEVGILALLAFVPAVWYFQRDVGSEDEMVEKLEVLSTNQADTHPDSSEPAQSDLIDQNVSAESFEPQLDLNKDLPRMSNEVQVRQQAVQDWETFIANFPEDENTDYLAMSALVKEKFNRMHPVDRIEPLRRSLLLLSDTQYIAVIDILTDNEQSSEVVMAIFDDILHRQDELKIPVLEILKNDKDNAASFEATRILDIIQDSAEPE